MSLFDPTSYGPGTPVRECTVKEPTIRDNHGEWFLVLRRGKEPYPLAHQLHYKLMPIVIRGKQQLGAWDGKGRWEGGWRTRCGLTGAALELPRGAEVNVCEKCAEGSSTGFALRSTGQLGAFG